MWRIISYAIIQSLLLTAGQVFLKFALAKMPSFELTKSFMYQFLSNWQFAVCGLCFALASVLWIYMIKIFPLSVAYPMISLSYCFGMIAAIIFFHEDVSYVKWVGVFFIMAGCFFIAR